MNIAEIVQTIKKAIDRLDIKATKNNCDSISVAHFWLDKIAEACNNVDKQKGGEPIDGKSEKQDD